MLRVSITILILALFTVISCSKYSSNTDCVPSSDCYPFPWDSGYVYVDVSYPGSGPGIPVILYEGYAEDEVIIWADTVFTDELIFWVPTRTRYAVEAYYNYGGQTIVALDGKKLNEESYDDCGETCYEESSIRLDVKKL
ncbi:hypothetical protein [Parvicella tangerina]|uniref:Uncharacterized protein n=1 Tax=Parvicella tangerina TaxID=2829795 RepID=A0A916JMB3_9FLAO|nr:hypothetical protein [Parvicella tangerina]CAG5082652.1 hypothetical protein CRYO30217_01974 [Parvicella tangerina]